jgi:gluconokinase
VPAIAQVVVMGVAGSGKSAVAARLAARLGCEMAEADDFHPAANVAKMSAGVPLDDEDRRPWLAAVAAWIGERDRAGRCAVVACSALGRAHRDVLRSASPHVVFVHLAVALEVAAGRVRARKGHFMPESLLASQFATLEPPGRDERAITIRAERTLEDVVEAAVAGLVTPAPDDAGSP